MTTTAFDAISAYIESTSPFADDFQQALDGAYNHAEEFSLSAPSPAVGQLLSTLASGTAGVEKPHAIAITPASSVAGLYLLTGLPEAGILSCIDPEAEHQAHAKETFRAAGIKPSRYRFLPSRPLDVIERMATEAYHVIFADVPTLDALPLLKAALPLLSTGGTLIIANSLLDGTVADSSRSDRATLAARELDSYAMELAQSSQAVVTRLPLGAGMTLITKR